MIEDLKGSSSRQFDIYIFLFFIFAIDAILKWQGLWIAFVLGSLI